jgi:hypothetical protein
MSVKVKSIVHKYLCFIVKIFKQISVKDVSECLNANAGDCRRVTMYLRCV